MPVFFVKNDNLVQIGVAFQDRITTARYNTGDKSIGKISPDIPNRGGRKQYVP
jgi:hypothetical protein